MTHNCYWKSKACIKLTYFFFSIYVWLFYTGLLNIICYNFPSIFLYLKKKNHYHVLYCVHLGFFLCSFYSFSLLPLLCSLSFCILIFIISLSVDQSHFHSLSVSFCLIHNLILSPLFLILLFARSMIVLHLSQSLLLSLLIYPDTFILNFIWVVLPYFSNSIYWCICHPAILGRQMCGPKTWSILDWY